MDKLIVTIISIAITAGSLYAGADYLSGFYKSAQARSKAQVWVAEAAQIALAAKQAGYLASGSDDWSVGTASYLVPTYMSSLPRHNGTYVFRPAYSNGATNTTFPRNNTDATIIISDQVESQEVCQEIQKLANRGDSTLPSAGIISGTTIAYTIAKNASQRFACARYAATNTHYFVYRVFLDRGTY
ncbi:MAG TPA: hypothetical protein PKW15_05150 [Alphaproteobacteria bacterium]|nr:hypothetical protein [Rhodospirillaceae bacterium]HRJ12612.1 hypothetical protein [Alphaproteobacteria bacterium]